MAISLKAVLIVVVSIVAVHTVATLKFLYWTIWWLDIPMHFGGGAWLAMLYFYISAKFSVEGTRLPPINRQGRDGQGSMPPAEKLWHDLILGLGFVALVGVLWEFSEFLLGNFMIIDQSGDYLDTLGDLFFDLLGGSIILAFTTVRQRLTS